MNIETKISTWIQEEGSFLAGLQLYREIGGKKIAYFERQIHQPFIDPKVKRELIRALKPYASAGPSPTPIKSSYDPAKPVQVQEPPEIVSLKKEAIKLHKKHSTLKGLLIAAADQDKYSDADRYEIARQIMEETIPKLDGIYATIRTWEKDGSIPAIGKSEIIRETVAKMKEIQSLRPAISRLKTRLKKETLSDVDRQDLELRLLEKQSRLGSLEDELGI
jgi:hypothetical protein